MTEFRFRVTPSPIGDILIVTGDDGIVTLHPFEGPVGFELQRVGLELSGHIVPDESVAEEAVDQLDEYFDGERTAFDLHLDWRLVRGFTRDALQAVIDIPFGETASYGEVAISAGSPRAARAVGTACANTPFSIVVPVHRVVRSDGSIGEYGGRPDIKRFLLELERDADV
ncbi:cysteine methyltransferase [Microbacterium sp. Root61]|uniref:methylated-DNA--[protein]-cysteine S-methyltransferase n=1 Tax=Microbacterium sp. Root61 TaxID=1736570 RepID=UPI0006F6A2CC|nr:methylated-DNA--[protein]-cysteine S-methyltransferase [Microbacterium sp. Root61]KRA24005.1 cysteine methyltransferase [Microbacterium sp. Root61]